LLLDRRRGEAERSSFVVALKGGELLLDHGADRRPIGDAERDSLIGMRWLNQHDEKTE